MNSLTSWNYEATVVAFLKKEINRVRPMPSNETLKPRPQNNNSDRTPFVIAFNPALSNVASAVRRNLNNLQASARCIQIFQSAPIVAYKRSPNLRDLLVRSQLRDHKVKPLPGSGNHNNATIHAVLHAHFYKMAKLNILPPPLKKNKISQAV